MSFFSSYEEKFIYVHKVLVEVIRSVKQSMTPIFNCSLLEDFVLKRENLDKKRINKFYPSPNRGTHFPKFYQQRTYLGKKRLMITARGF